MHIISIAALTCGETAIVYAAGVLRIDRYSPNNLLSARVLIEADKTKTVQARCVMSPGLSIQTCNKEFIPRYNPAETGASFP